MASVIKLPRLHSASRQLVPLKKTFDTPSVVFVRFSIPGRNSSSSVNTSGSLSIDPFTRIGWPDHVNRLPLASNWKVEQRNKNVKKITMRTREINSFSFHTYTQFQFAQIFCVGVSLHNGHLFAAGLFNHRRIGSVDFFGIWLFAGVKKCIRMSANDNINQRTIACYFLVHQIARMTQRNDDIHTFLLQIFRFLTVSEKRNRLGISILFGMGSWECHTYLMPITSGLNIKSFGMATNFVSGVKYPTTPTLNPLISNTTDFLRARVWNSGCSAELFRFATSTGKLTSFSSGIRPSMPKSSSWFPNDFSGKREREKKSNQNY